MPDKLLYDIKELFSQVGEGNEPAFRTLFDFYKERFYTASLKMTHSGDIAEEIVQEVFINLWIKRVKVAAAINPEAYLLTMLHNSIYTHFRKLASEIAMKREVGKNSAGIDAHTGEDILLAKESKEMLEVVLGQLPPQQRLVYKLSRQQELSREQIATQLSISPHTVKNHLQQATQFIRAYYKTIPSTLIWIAIWQSI